MNYRHGFHAGNFADVVKHVALALALARLTAKDKPLRYMETHAGSGLYALDGEAARRSPEWRDGVARVLAALAAAPDAVRSALAPWERAVAARNPQGGLAVYPGSPAIAQTLLRPGDAIRLCELHPEEAAALAATMGRDRRVKLEARDGAIAVAAWLPPPERRGLLLVDPPFEEGTAERRRDFALMLSAARRALSRWREGTLAFWRPLKDPDAVAEFDGALATLAIEEAGLAPEKLLAADLWVRAPGPGPLAGAGVVILHPPFGVEEGLRAALPWLAGVLAQGEGAGWRLATPEAAPDQDA